MHRQADSRRLCLSVLDLCKRPHGASAREALRNSVRLASLAEELGYSRYWIAEHHTSDAAQASPEVLIPMIAAATKRIRVGAGGILLRYQSPLKVAESFMTLAAMFPGRIDLGICHGPGGTDDATAVALVDGNIDELSWASYARKVGALAAFLKEGRRAGRSESERRWQASGIKPPPLWILGSSEYSLNLALAERCRYGFTMVFGCSAEYGARIMKQYRRARIGDERILAVSVLCARTSATACRIHRDLVQGGCLPSNVVGSPADCRRILERLARDFQTREIMMTTFIDDYDSRAEFLRMMAPR